VFWAVRPFWTLQEWMLGRLHLPTAELTYSPLTTDLPTDPRQADVQHGDQPSPGSHWLVSSEVSLGKAGF